MQEERGQLRKLEAEAAVLQFNVATKGVAEDALRLFNKRKQIDNVLENLMRLEHYLAQAKRDMEKDMLARAKAKAREQNEEEAKKKQASMMRQFE